MQQSEKIEELSESLKMYVNTNCELIKLQATERTSVIGAAMISIILIVLLGVLFLLFISFWAGFYLSEKLGDNYSGFVIVAGFYFLLCVILIIGRKRLIEKPIRDKIILKIFSRA